jgi:DNA-binding XRE family transcriptional regulator
MLRSELVGAPGQDLLRMVSSPRMSKRIEPSPVGPSADESPLRRVSRSHAYGQAQAGKDGYREIAWLLIKYRMEHGVTQEQLAKRVGTSYSQISRIESGRQRTTLETLLRVARALDLKMVIGFEETGGAAAGRRELVAI